MTRKNIATYLLPVAVTIAVAMMMLGKCRATPSMPYQKSSGFIFGTSYNVTYESEKDYSEDILNVLNKIDSSLSPFNEKSTITAVNNSDGTPVKVDEMFAEVFNTAKDVNTDTQGAFDITVAPLVNAWGFGFKNGIMPTAAQVDSIKTFIGFSKVSMKDNAITKQDRRIMLDCGAIAKGFAVDKVAEMLTEKGVTNFMVEIGGEIVVKGNNPEGKPWHIGVIKPADDSLSVSNEMQARLILSDKAMATSGNYRNFYYKDGKKYAHPIDPKTGYPVQHNILSATVLAPTCMQADAYATSFMVMGLDKARQILDRHKEMAAYIIYNDNKGNYATCHSPELDKYIDE